MGLRMSISAAAAAVAISAPIGTAVAQTLDVSIFHSPRSAWSNSAKWWAEAVKKRTDGRVQLKLFFASALSKVNETYKAVRDGAIPIGTTSAASISGQIPAMAYIEGLAGMANNATGFLAVSKALRPEMTRLLAAKKIEYLWIQPSFGAMASCREKHLKKPSDWKGLRIRAAGRWQVQQVKALGGRPVALDPAEMYLALQNRTVDCVLGNHELTLGLKLYEVGKYVTNLRVPVNVVLYIGNPRILGKLSKKDHAALIQAAVEAEKVAADGLEPLQGKLRALITKRGGNVYSLSDSERAAFVAAIRPTFDAMDKVTGTDGAKIRKILEPHWK